MLRCGQWMGPRVDGKENVFKKDKRLYAHGGEHKQIGKKGITNFGHKRIFSRIAIFLLLVILVRMRTNAALVDLLYGSLFWRTSCLSLVTLNI